MYFLHAYIVYLLRQKGAWEEIVGVFFYQKRGAHSYINCWCVLSKVLLFIKLSMSFHHPMGSREEPSLWHPVC